MRLNVAHKLSICAVLLALISVIPTKAIELSGRIRGVVTDPSGAVIAGATVSVTNDATGITKTMSTTADGSYEAIQLPAPSAYTVRAEMKGFKTFEAHAVRLGVDQIYVLNVPMELGQVTQMVTVEASAAQVERTSIQLGATISASQIVDMPLNGRNWVALQQTMPGVVAASDGRGNYATNGSQTDQNSFLVNGIDTNDLPLNTPLVIPSPDAIAEFHMVTNTINPEYGRNSGAILNAVTKSGGNAFHGSGFEFYRDTGLNARNFFQPKPIVFHQHQFGGTVGGPIRRDHTFFFFSYQGTRNRVPAAGGNVKVFTADQRNGLFPEIATSSTLSPFPLTGEDGTVYPAGKPYSTIFPTGQIPSADFNPLATSLLDKFVPPPNVGTNYQFNPITTGKADQYMAKIDHNFGSKDAIWGSWFYQISPDAATLPFTGGNLPGFPMTNKRHIHQYVATWNHTFSPTTLNEARIGYTRFNYAAVAPVDVLDPASVGFTGITPQNPAYSSWPRVDVSGFFRLGFTSNGPQPRIDQTYQFSDNFSSIRGRHTIKAGFDMRRFQVYNDFFARLSGYYQFLKTGKYSTGDPAANFLLGIPTSYNQSGGDTVNARAQGYYMYFQDQWKARPNLTITYGTGWSIDTPLVDNYHANHAMIAFRPGQQSTVFTNSPAGYVFQGDAGVHATGTTKYGHFGPRIGFVWSPGSSTKWSLRGAYGIYFNRSLEEQALQFVLSGPYGVNSGGVLDASTAANPLSPSFADPWTDIAGHGSIPNKFPAPLDPPSNIAFGDYLPLSISVLDPNYSTAYSQNYNLTLQHELPASSVLSLAWVGALGRKLIITRELNPGINPAGCAANPDCVGDPTSQNVNFPNNFRYPGNVFGSVGNIQTTGISNYNSFQATLDKHMSHGLGFRAIYTWSHSLDDGSGFENAGFGGGGFGGFGYLRGTNPFNQSLYNYGSSIFDATHRFVIAYTYEIPGIRHFNNWAAKRFVEGWRMTGITTFQTGFPLDVVDGNVLSLTCVDGLTSFYACSDIPNVVSKPQYVDPRWSVFINQATDPSNGASNDHYWFNPNTFAVEAPGTFGNAGRNLMRGPRIANFDFALFKSTSITEKTRMELRFEFYNLFNHTQFNPNGMDTDISSSDFGRISLARDPRIIQLAAKIYF